MVYVYKSVFLSMVFLGLWSRGVWSDVWAPVEPPSDVDGMVAGCRETVVSGAVYVVKLVTAPRGGGVCCGYCLNMWHFF
jgi:hypothetical protein